MVLEEIAKEIANQASVPYVWEDVLDRLKEGIALPSSLMIVKTVCKQHANNEKSGL